MKETEKMERVEGKESRKRKVEIYDATLREGAQRQGISFSLQDKIRIATELDKLGIDYIEAGFPGSNRKDEEFFERILSLKLNKARITAFGSTCRKELAPEDDKNLQILAKLDKKIVITLVGKTWDKHIINVLGTTLEENLRMIEESCAFLTQQSFEVFFDAEHFFDGFKDDSQYAIECLKKAEQGGAKRIILCDTNGGTLTWDIGEIVDRVKKEIETPLGIHAHNDSGLALANSLEAIRHGIAQVQVTLNGFGERCGNADICSVLPILQIKMGIKVVEEEQLTRLTSFRKAVYEIANVRPDPFQPFVGERANYDKAGQHVNAEMKCPGSYRHIDFRLVGNSSESKTGISELSGKSSIQVKAREFDIDLSPEEEKNILAEIKRLEYVGFQFEGADGSLEVLMRRQQNGYFSRFKIISYKVISGQKEKGEQINKAWVVLKIKFRRKTKTIKSSGEGDGPVNALDNAIRPVLAKFYPVLNRCDLIDYKVRILENGGKGTEVSVRVLADFSDGENNWTTIGVSTNILEASLLALVDGLEFAILREPIQKEKKALFDVLRLKNLLRQRRQAEKQKR